MPLEPITLRDSDEAATSNSQALFIDRNTAAHLGHDTLRAIREGNYLLEDGSTVDWSAAVTATLDAKVCRPSSGTSSARPAECTRDCARPSPPTPTPISCRHTPARLTGAWSTRRATNCNQGW